MATMNRVRCVGFLREDPVIEKPNVPGEEKAIITLRTVRRSLEGYKGSMTEDVLVYYDQEELMPRIKKLKKLDLIDITGVFNILSVSKRGVCPECHTVTVKPGGTLTFVYPIHLVKVNSLWKNQMMGEITPEEILKRHYKEVSNEINLIGTVDNDPEIVTAMKNVLCCRYRLRVDRQYLIKTQQTQKIDFPWVYSYATQADRDITYLHKGSVILVRGFIRNRSVKSNIRCCNESCGEMIAYTDVATEFIPYSVEYLRDFETDESLAAKKYMQNMGF